MAKLQQRAIAGFFAAIFLISTCALTIAIIWQATQSDDSKNNQAKEQQVDPQNQLQGKQLENFTPGAAITELKVEDIKPGTGKEVKAGDTVTVDYTGALASNGVIFQSSKDTGQPVSFPLSSVIAGWSQGIPGMKEGGVRRLLIPAALAYGPQAQDGIPANSDLVFDVTLHKVGQ